MSQLSPADLAAFVRDGYLRLPQAVPPALVAGARHAIDAWARQDMDPELVPAYTRTTFAPDLTSTPVLLDLYAATGLAQVAEQLIGPTAPVVTCQVQMRLPASPDGAQPVKSMHVDGVSCPHLDPAELRTFTLLVGVLLSDVATASDGALHYVPAGHEQMARWFSHEWSLGISDQVPPSIDSDHGTPVLGQAGDAVLLHHLTPHAVGANTGPASRTVVYFRVSHSRHHQHRLEALRDPWLDYTGVRPDLDDLGRDAR